MENLIFKNEEEKQIYNQLKKIEEDFKFNNYYVIKNNEVSILFNENNSIIKTENINLLEKIFKNLTEQGKLPINSNINLLEYIIENTEKLDLSLNIKKYLYHNLTENIFDKIEKKYGIINEEIINNFPYHLKEIEIPHKKLIINYLEKKENFNINYSKIDDIFNKDNEILLTIIKKQPSLLKKILKNNDIKNKSIIFDKIINNPLLQEYVEQLFIKDKDYTYFFHYLEDYLKNKNQDSLKMIENIYNLLEKNEDIIIKFLNTKINLQLKNNNYDFVIYDIYSMLNIKIDFELKDNEERYAKIYFENINKEIFKEDNKKLQIAKYINKNINTITNECLQKNKNINTIFNIYLNENININDYNKEIINKVFHINNKDYLTKNYDAICNKLQLFDINKEQLKIFCSCNFVLSNKYNDQAPLFNLLKNKQELIKTEYGRNLLMVLFEIDLENKKINLDDLVEWIILHQEKDFYHKLTINQLNNLPKLSFYKNVFDSKSQSVKELLKNKDLINFYIKEITDRYNWKLKDKEMRLLLDSLGLSSIKEKINFFSFIKTLFKKEENITQNVIIKDLDKLKNKIKETKNDNNIFELIEDCYKYSDYFKKREKEEGFKNFYKQTILSLEDKLINTLNIYLYNDNKEIIKEVSNNLILIKDKQNLILEEIKEKDLIKLKIDKKVLKI